MANHRYLSNDRLKVGEVEQSIVMKIRYFSHRSTCYHLAANVTLTESWEDATFTIYIKRNYSFVFLYPCYNVRFINLTFQGEYDISSDRILNLKLLSILKYFCFERLVSIIKNSKLPIELLN